MDDNEKLKADLAAAEARAIAAEKKVAESELKRKEEAETFNRAEEERKVLETKHKNTLAANERLSKSKEEKTSEIDEAREQMRVLKELLEEDAKLKKEALEAAEQAKKIALNDLVEKSLKEQGFTSTDLLVGKIDISKLKIENGKIKDFDTITKDFQEKYPTLYVDGAATPNTGNSISFEKKIDMVTYLENVENKIKDGKQLEKDEQMIAIFGNIKNN